jgi:AbrB family looped-hinge helix DNA binding protein
MATERIQIPIDRFGRIVLPKEIRERFGVSAGSEFEIEERDDAILLKPVRREAKIVNKGGWLVVQTEGPPITVEDVNEAVEKSRRENKGQW